MISRAKLVVGSVLMQLAIGKYRLRVHRTCGRSKQTLAPPADNVKTGMEFLVDLPMRSLVGQQEEKKVCRGSLNKAFLNSPSKVNHQVVEVVVNEP